MSNVPVSPQMSPHALVDQLRSLSTQFESIQTNCDYAELVVPEGLLRLWYFRPDAVCEIEVAPIPESGVHVIPPLARYYKALRSACQETWLATGPDDPVEIFRGRDPHTVIVNQRQGLLTLQLDIGNVRKDEHKWLLDLKGLAATIRDMHLPNAQSYIGYVLANPNVPTGIDGQRLLWSADNPACPTALTLGTIGLTYDLPPHGVVLGYLREKLEKATMGINPDTDWHEVSRQVSFKLPELLVEFHKEMLTLPKGLGKTTTEDKEK